LPSVLSPPHNRPRLEASGGNGAAPPGWLARETREVEDTDCRLNGFSILFPQIAGRTRASLWPSSYLTPCAGIVPEHQPTRTNTNQKHGAETRVSIGWRWGELVPVAVDFALENHCTGNRTGGSNPPSSVLVID